MLSSATVKYACNEVTTKHWVDNPKVKFVPVEVTLPQTTCSNVEIPLPNNTCELVLRKARTKQNTRKSIGGEAPRVPVDMFLTPKESKSPTSTGQEPFISVNELLIHKLPSSILLIIRKYCSLEESRMS